MLALRPVSAGVGHMRREERELTEDERHGRAATYRSTDPRGIRVPSVEETDQIVRALANLEYDEKRRSR